MSDSSKENDKDMDTAEFDEGESRDNAIEKEEDREPEDGSSNSMPPTQSKKTAPAKPKPVDTILSYFHWRRYLQKQPKEDAPKRAKKSKKVFDSDDSMDDFIVDSDDSGFDKVIYDFLSFRFLKYFQSFIVIDELFFTRQSNTMQIFSAQKEEDCR